ncbi:MAG TPA: septum formation initiator [Stellaceae bacterium]|nr:septum formation initiator [Stellaceae bacterium]
MSRPCRSLLLLASLLPLRLAAPALAQEAPRHAPAEKPAAAAPAPSPVSLLPADSVTHHQVKIGDRQLGYTATAGTLPLRDDKGEKQADIFYVAFTLDGVGDRTQRPVTYAFNGGPGAASAYLDIGALGPRALDFGAAGLPQPAVDHVGDNPDSWLPFTDLVFLDPISTGYSRAVSEEAAKKLTSVDPDLDALAQIVRLHLARSDRLASPVYLVGESYGGFRAARLALLLAQREGVAPAGVMMVSPVIEFRLMSGDRFDVLPWALRLPSYAAVALDDKHALSPEALGEAERFALGDYLTVLAAGETGRPENFYRRLAELTGLDEAVVARWGGRVPAGAYVKAMRHAERQIVSRYDGTVAAPDPDPASFYVEDDPILEGTVAPFTRAFTAYARDELGFATDLSYILLNGELGRHWEWREGNSGDRQSLGAADALARALSLQPKLKVLIAHGFTDLTTPYMMSRYVVEHLPANLTAERVSLKLYPGGHLLYLRTGSRRHLREDAAAFYGAP